MYFPFLQQTFLLALFSSAVGLSGIFPAACHHPLWTVLALLCGPLTQISGVCLCLGLRVLVLVDVAPVPSAGEAGRCPEALPVGAMQKIICERLPCARHCF